MMAISAIDWWVLVEPCDTFVDHVAGGAPGLFELEHTTDGGATFSSVSLPSTLGQYDTAPQVEFADDSNGWIAGWATHDGGQQWNQLPVDITQLEPGASGWVYAVTTHVINAYQFTWDVHRAQADSDDWSNVLSIPGHAASGPLVIAVYGSTLWVMDLSAQGGLWVSDDGGATFTVATRPCPSPNGGNDELDAVSDTVIWAYCTDASGTGYPLVSTDAGRSWRTGAFSGSNSGLIAGISAQMAFVAADGLWRTDNGGATFPSIPAWSSSTMWIGFSSSTVGCAIVSDPQIATEPWRTQLWCSSDGGVQWTMLHFEGQG